MAKEVAQSVPFGFQLKVTLLASRDHLCIHPGLSFLKGAALIAGCHQKLKHHVGRNKSAHTKRCFICLHRVCNAISKTCHLEGGLSRFKSDALMVPRDIEELRSFGQRVKVFCHLFFGPCNNARQFCFTYCAERVLSVLRR